MALVLICYKMNNKYISKLKHIKNKIINKISLNKIIKYF